LAVAKVRVGDGVCELNFFADFSAR
jgi:hypothetical protein